MRRLLVLLVATVVSVAACDPPDEAAAPPERGVDLGELALIGLVTEDACAPLLEWFKEAAGTAVEKGTALRFPMADAAGGEAAVAATGGADAAQGGAARVAGSDYSTTNIQEEGVDEPDVVKTDGRRLVALAGGHLRIVDVTGAEPVLRASVPAPNALALFLVEDRVLVVSGSGGGWGPMPMRGAAADVAGPSSYGDASTSVTVFDISDAAKPSKGETVRLDGGYASARLVDGVVRLVLRWTPAGLYRKMAEAGAAPGDVVASSTIDDWKPDHVPCDQVHHPEQFTGGDAVSVVTIDPDDPRPGNGASVAGAGETIYASRDRLYVTSGQWTATPSTVIHAFDIGDETTTRYLASGSVDGMLLNQFSLSEHDGVLRVATTTTNGSDGQSESQVVTLRQEGAELTEVGRLGGLGKTEQIFAVRFLADTGYVVTFRQTDPLYVIDLKDPAKPQMKGELKIPGFSSYLHPIGDGRVLGVGQDATEEGRRLGSQLSLFDVRDPSNPMRVATHDLQSYGSTAEYDHHAFLWWAKERVAIVPTDGAVGMEHRPGAVVVTVEGDRLVRRGRVEHPTNVPIMRSLVVGDALLTMSDTGILASGLASLDERAWVAF